MRTQGASVANSVELIDNFAVLNIALAYSHLLHLGLGISEMHMGNILNDWLP